MPYEPYYLGSYWNTQSGSAFRYSMCVISCCPCFKCKLALLILEAGLVHLGHSGFLPIPFLDVIKADTCLVCSPWYPSLLLPHETLETLFYSPQRPWYWYRLYRCITPRSVSLSNWRQCLFAPKPPSRCLFSKAAWAALRLPENHVSQHSDSFLLQNPCAILSLPGPMRKHCSATSYIWSLAPSCLPGQMSPAVAIS